LLARLIDLIVADPKTSLPRVSEIPDKTEIESLLYQRTLIPFLNEINDERSAMSGCFVFELGVPFSLG
jgi:hypothetical protein